MYYYSRSSSQGVLRIGILRRGVFGKLCGFSRQKPKIVSGSSCVQHTRDGASGKLKRFEDKVVRLMQVTLEQDKGKAKEQHKPEHEQTLKHLEEVFGEDFEAQSTLGMIRIDPGTPPLGIDPISSNQKDPEIPEQSYCPPGNETVRSTIQYSPAISSNAQNTVYFHTPESSPIGDQIAADEYDRQHAGILKEVLVSALDDAGYAGVGAGVQREPRQKAQSTRRPVSFNGYTARPPMDERYPAQLSARSAPSLRHREQSSAYGQSDRGHEPSPPVNSIPSRGGGEAKPNQKTLWDWILRCFGRIGRENDPDGSKKSINYYKVQIIPSILFVRFNFHIRWLII